jgi:hypothetical protein
LPSRLKTTDLEAEVAKAWMVQDDGKLARERVSPFSSGPITVLLTVTVFISTRLMMACDLTWSKMVMNNRERRAIVFMVLFAMFDKKNGGPS